jgi:hypothetical protein
MDLQLPDEERPTSRREDFHQLVERLSRQSVAKHFDAYADIAWDAPELRIDPDDPRFQLAPEHALGATAWYRAQPDATRARIGLTVIALAMKVGVQFENVLSRGLLAFAARRPNAAPEFRYALHELIEESQHSLMFQEFINRSGANPDGITGWRALLTEPVARLGARFPELFFLFVLGGEDPIDHLQRTAMAAGNVRHPLLRRISQIHVTEEARHLCFARHYLREHVPRLSRPRRALVTVGAPLILSQMARTMLEPSAQLIARFQIPRAVVDEAWRRNPRHRAAVAESLEKVRALCVELDLVSRPLWRAWGVG